MIPLILKLLAVLTCFIAMYLSTEAADADRVTTTPSIPGVPGRDGKDGQPGRDGHDGVARPGPLGTAIYVCPEQLKEDIEMLQEKLHMLSCCNVPCTPQCAGTTSDNPATSCKAIYEHNPTAPSGYYWVTTNTGPLQVYCQMEINNCGDITGGWMRAAYIDMTNVSNTCPQGLKHTSFNSTRMCMDVCTGAGCTSVTFPTHMLPYTKVCGRVRGYQFGSPDGFSPSFSQNSPDSSYADGLLITYGSLKNHIWTFAVGVSKDYTYGGHYTCPCGLYPGTTAPPFVGENYFCESGVTGQWESQWYLTDPLWDSQGCASGSTCCNRGGPWFTTTLSQEVSDDIEVRLCLDEANDNEGIGLEQLEILVI